MDPQLQILFANLAEAGFKNLASTVQDKIKASKAKNNASDTIATLEEIVGELLAERAELLRMAQALETELVAQRPSDDDVEFITENLLPIIGQMGGPTNEVNLLKPLLSSEALKILQLLGFNYREAIGAPLTKVVSSYVANLAPKAGQNKSARKK